jgi:predicted PurR-regulated permease PerM
VSGVLPSVIAVLFGYFLPIVIRKISKYQGAPTRSRLDRAVTARYFIIFSNMFVFTLIGVVYSSIATVVTQIGQHKSVWEVLDGLKEIPYRTYNPLSGAYIQLTGRNSRDLCSTVDILAHLAASAWFLGLLRVDSVDQAGARLSPEGHVPPHAARS